MAGQLRAPLLTLDPLTGGVASIRVPLLTVDPLAEGSPNLRGALLTVDALSEGFRNLRAALLIIESLHPVAPEPYMSTALFPGSLGSSASLPGLAFSFHKRPKFATNKHVGASGVSVRNALMQYPIWEFEATYEFLEDSSGANSSLKSLMGFFLSRQAGFDTFLFKDKDDYLTTNDALGTADGVTTQFSFKRSLGGYSEKIGQIDQGQTISLYGSINESRSVPGAAAYTITTTNSAAWVEDLGVTLAGVPMVKVAASPAAGQYSVAAGVYTFNSANASAAVIIRYRYTLAPALYTITLPNLAVFTTAPAAGMLISADFQFFFVCLFQEDMLDFEKFADKLWQLQTVTFETAL